MNRILNSDWLPGRVLNMVLSCPLGMTRCVSEEHSFDRAGQDGWILAIFFCLFVCLFVCFFASLWTETGWSVSIGCIFVGIVEILTQYKRYVGSRNVHPGLRTSRVFFFDTCA